MPYRFNSHDHVWPASFDFIDSGFSAFFEANPPAQHSGRIHSSKRIYFEFRNHIQIRSFAHTPIAKLSADNNPFDFKSIRPSVAPPVPGARSSWIRGKKGVGALARALFCLWSPYVPPRRMFRGSVVSRERPLVSLEADSSMREPSPSPGARKRLASSPCWRV
jgi:hypothetical protein